MTQQQANTMHRFVLVLWPLLLMAVLGACDNWGQTRVTAQPDTQTGDRVDPHGVLRLPMDLSIDGGLSLDPIDPTNPTNIWMHYLVYDTLLRQREDGSYEPGLARTVSVVDPYTIKIKLQEGVSFHDGSPLTAAAVERSIQRTIESNNAGGHRLSELKTLQEIIVDGPTSLTLRLSTPTAGSFYNLLAHNESFVVSSRALDQGTDLTTRPVGAGPFRVVRYDAESRVVMEKYQDYFQTDAIRLAGIEILQVAGSAAIINALRAGTYGHDPDRARALLKAAAIGDLHLTTAVMAAGGVTVKVAEPVQQQWRDIGISLELIPTTDVVGEFYVGGRMDIFPGQQVRTWIDKVTRMHVPGSVGATCIPKEPEFIELITQLRSLAPEDPLAVERWHELQALLNRGAYSVFLAMMTVDNVWNPARLGNPHWRRNQVGYAYPDVWKVYIKQR